MNALDSFKARDASSYDPLVGQFDVLVSRHCEPFAARIVALAAPPSSGRVLDVGCGTGIATLAIAESVPRGQVLGVDLSDGMLRVATGKASARKMAHVNFRKMDAEALNLSDGSFDVVVSLFALTHFPDPLRALGEMRRVLVPGGRLVLGVGGRPLLFSRAGAAAALSRIQRAIGERRGRQLTAPFYLDALTEQHLARGEEREETVWAGRGARAEHVRRLVSAAGFRDLRVGWLEQRVVLDGAEAFWEIQSTWSTIARKRLTDAPDAAVRALRAEFNDACAAVLRRGGQLTYPLAAFYVSAVRP